MAKIAYRVGLLKLSHDLTNPKSGSEPVAVVGTMHMPSSKTWHVFFLVAGDLEQRRAIVADPVSADILRQLPKVLIEQVHTAVAARVSPERLLNWINDQMRGNLHFSWIKEQTKRATGTTQPDLIKATMRDFAKFLSESKPKKKKTARVPHTRKPAEQRYTTFFQPVSRNRVSKPNVQAAI